MQDNVADGSCSRSKPGTLSFEAEPSTPLVLQQLLQPLEISGLMSPEEGHRFLKELTPQERPASGGDLTKILFRKGKLTELQAEAVYRARSKRRVLGDNGAMDPIEADPANGCQSRLVSPGCIQAECSANLGILGATGLLVSQCQHAASRQVHLTEH